MSVQTIIMGFQLFSACAATTLLIILSFLIMRRLQAAKKVDHLNLTGSSLEPTVLSRNLASALPDGVIFQHDAAAFKQSMNSYWAQQECEVIPACVVRPHNIQQLCTAVIVLKRTYDEREKLAGQKKAEGLFAIRSGGHSPVSGAATIKGGVVIDLGLFHEVTPTEDGSSVVIGAGARWMDVSKVLDEKGLAVVGGRNSAVGVGGLTLGGKFPFFTFALAPLFGFDCESEPWENPLAAPTFHPTRTNPDAQLGGLSFFSPQFGLVCSNIISYELVLASGAITTASASTNPDLWRALKGGSNNFGIVTRFRARSFPSTKIWSGFLYMRGSQAVNVLAAFHEYVNRACSSDPSTTYDNHAAGPIACFSYIQKLGAHLIAVNLVYTKLLENHKKWPACWRTSFGSLWRLWNTCKVRTLTSATDELNVLNPPGRRQVFATTTIKNDPATLAAAHAAYCDAIASIRHVKIKGLVWTLVLQPLLPDWVCKGDANSLGLDECTHGPLVIVSFTINWADSRHDEVVKNTTRRAVEQIDAVAAANKTGPRFRYLNYCAEWQRPFEGYGEENRMFLQGVSRRYDPEGLFQRGCVGGFKLDVVDGET